MWCAPGVRVRPGQGGGRSHGTSQTLHVVEQLERLGTPRGLAVEAMESTNKFIRQKKLTRTNQQNASAVPSAVWRD